MDNTQKFRDMTDAELQSQLVSYKNELFNLRFQQTTGQLKNPLMLRIIKKDIARIMTIQNERKKKGGSK
jgi:large subunit ribosomal protein L29